MSETENSGLHELAQRTQAIANEILKHPRGVTVEDVDLNGTPGKSIVLGSTLLSVVRRDEKSAVEFLVLIDKNRSPHHGYDDAEADFDHFVVYAKVSTPIAAAEALVSAYVSEQFSLTAENLFPPDEEEVTQ
jgi:hypothetical protein